MDSDGIYLRTSHKKIKARLMRLVRRLAKAECLSLSAIRNEMKSNKRVILSHLDYRMGMVCITIEEDMHDTLRPRRLAKPRYALSYINFLTRSNYYDTLEELWYDLTKEQ